MIYAGIDISKYKHDCFTLTLNTYGQFLPSQCGAAAQVFNPLFEQTDLGQDKKPPPIAE